MSASPFKVITTRPEARAATLLTSLEAAHISALNIPLLAITPRELSHTERQAILNLDQFDGIIVVSPSAADCLLDIAEDYWPQWPVETTWYGLGEGTRRRLAQADIDCDTPVQGDTSEALLQKSGLQQLDGQRFLLAAGEGGRTLLADSLTERGAQVTRLSLYRREKPKLNPAQIQQLLTATTDALVATSGESVAQLVSFMDNAQQWQRYHTPLLVPSHRVAEFARTQGFDQVIDTQGANPEAIVSALKLLATSASVKG